MQPIDSSPPDIQQLRAEVDKVMQSVREFDEQIDERNTQRLLYSTIKRTSSRRSIPKVRKIITQTIEAVKPAPDPSTLPPLEIDEQNPLESLRKIRCQIAQEVCQVMGVEPPHV